MDTQIDPYKVLNIPQNYNADMLKKAYKTIALQAHPDKGGSEYLFKLVTQCYKYLAKELERRENDKQHYELKQQQTSQKQQPQSSHVQDVFYSGSRFDREKFNKFFMSNKFNDDSLETGYEEWMNKNKARKTPSYKSSSGDFQTSFNAHFERNAQVAKDNRQIIKFKEPEPLVACNKLAFFELGQDEISDFSGDNKTNRSLNFMDYRVAHTTTRLVDPSIVKRKSFNNIIELEKERENVRFTMTEKEMAQYAKQQQTIKLLEQKQQDSLRAYDQKVEQFHQRVSGMLKLK